MKLALLYLARIRSFTILCKSFRHFSCRFLSPQMTIKVGSDWLLIHSAASKEPCMHTRSCGNFSDRRNQCYSPHTAPTLVLVPKHERHYRKMHGPIQPLLAQANDWTNNTDTNIRVSWVLPVCSPT